MTDRRDRLATVLTRELRTIRRSRLYLLLWAGFLLVVAVVASLSGTSGYVPLVLSLLAPVELLVPVLAAAFGYRSVLADRERGETAVLKTFPVTRAEYVGGVFLARFFALLAVVGLSLFVLVFAVPLFGRAGTFLAQPSGLDSPLLYLRFVVLAGLFGGVVLAVTTLLSAVAGTARRGVVFAAVLVVVLALGFDIAAVGSLGGGASPLGELLTVSSPNGAFRGLVLRLVVAPATTTPVDAPPVVLGVGVLLAWGVGALVAAGALVWRPPTRRSR